MDSPISWGILVFVVLLIIFVFAKMAIEAHERKEKEGKEFWENQDRIFWD